jgi:hypothetical protein
MRVRTIRLMALPLATVAVMVTLVTLAGCGSHSPAANGPLASRVDDKIPRGANCVPGGHAQTFGDQLFTNHCRVAVVLDGVTLLHPRNERLIGSYAVPGTLLIGIVFWPPKYPGMPSTWIHRKPVHGFRLAPGKSFNMVLGVTTATSGRASSQGMLVHYHDSTGMYVARNYFAMIIAASKRGC